MSVLFSIPIVLVIMFLLYVLINYAIQKELKELNDEYLHDSKDGKTCSNNVFNSKVFKDILQDWQTNQGEAKK